MAIQTKPWAEQTELERFIDALEGTLLTRADAKDVEAVIERLERAVAAEREAIIDRISHHNFGILTRDGKNYIDMEELNNVLREGAAR